MTLRRAPPGTRVDGVLLEWGSLLYAPRPRRVKPGSEPSFSFGGSGPGRLDAAEIRRRIAATVRAAPQAVVKITGGSRGMHFIKGHLHYISQQGRLELTDERGDRFSGREGLQELADDWRIAGSYIDDKTGRREALHIALSMPSGTPDQALVSSVSTWAAREFKDHRYVHVLHDHQANPHVHLMVRIEDRFGRRLDPHKIDLQRWREGFAQALREQGIDAQATRQLTHGATKGARPIWRVKAHGEGAPDVELEEAPAHQIVLDSVRRALTAWGHVHNALAGSSDPADRTLAREVRAFLSSAPAVRQLARAQGKDLSRSREQNLPAKGREQE